MLPLHVMKQFIETQKSIKCNGKLLVLDKPLVMGILNLTPDSFYDGNFYNNKEKILRQIHKIINEGAQIIDIGAYSSRPGAKNITEKEELKRLVPALELILKHFPEMVVSVDTFRSKIAKLAVNDFGVSLINDISGGTIDKKMFEQIANLNVPYILMHMRGNPQTMQNLTDYKNIVDELIDYFVAKTHILKKAGVKDIIIDPGFGFSKTLEQNYELLNKLEAFKILELPILVGISRKSMIYRYLNIKPEGALNGTSILNTIAIQKGADILRVHDVKEAVETIKLYGKLTEKSITR
jgi:dihydropteroate synthase